MSTITAAARAVVWNPLDETYPSETVWDPDSTIRDPEYRWRHPRVAYLGCDLFAPGVTETQILDVWCVMEQARRHEFHVTTAHPKRLAAFLRGRWVEHANAYSNHEIPSRRTCPAAVWAYERAERGTKNIVIAVIRTGYRQVADVAGVD